MTKKTPKIEKEENMSVSLLPPPQRDTSKLAVPYIDTSHVTTDLFARNNENTPDFLELKVQQHVPVFVYDDMKVGGKYSSIFDSAGTFYLGEARTGLPNNLLYLSEHGHPVAFKIPKGTQSSGFLYGDVFAVPPETILEIDRVNKNNFLFHRKKTYVCMLDQHYTTRDGAKRPIIPVWVYYGDEEFWSDQTMDPGVYKDFDGKKWFWYDHIGV